MEIPAKETIFSRAHKALGKSPAGDSFGDELEQPNGLGPLGVLGKIRGDVAKDKASIDRTKTLLQYAQQETPWDNPKTTEKIKKQAEAMKIKRGPPATKARKAASLAEGDETLRGRTRNERKIKAYEALTTKYPEVYGGIVKPSSPVKASDKEEDVARKLAEVQAELDGTASKKYGKQLMYLLVGNIEGANEQLKRISPAWAKRDLRLQGMARAMEAPGVQKSLDPLFEEFMIKYDTLFSASVELRLVGVIVQICAQVDDINRHPELYASATKPVDENEVNDILKK